MFQVWNHRASSSTIYPPILFEMGADYETSYIIPSTFVDLFLISSYDISDESAWQLFLLDISFLASDIQQQW